MTEAPKLDKVGLRLDGVSNEERFDLWGDITRPLFNVSAIRKGIELPVQSADAWLLDNLVMMEATFGSHVFNHQVKHAVNVADSLLIQIYTRGILEGDIDGQAYTIMPGDLHVLDFSRAHMSRTTNASVFGFLISHDLVGYDRDRHPREMTVPREGAVGRILRSTVLNVFESLDHITKAEQKAVADAWGFSSVSHFSREFQRKFGFSPGSIVGTRSQDRASGDISIASRPDSTDLLPFRKKT